MVNKQGGEHFMFCGKIIQYQWHLRADKHRVQLMIDHPFICMYFSRKDFYDLVDRFAEKKSKIFLYKDLMELVKKKDIFSKYNEKKFKSILNSIIILKIIYNKRFIRSLLACGHCSHLGNYLRDKND